MALDRRSVTTGAIPPAATGSAEWLNQLTTSVREKGDFARFRQGWLFSHPDAVRDLLVTHDRSFKKSPAMWWAKLTLGNGLLTNDGESHRRQRAMIQPSLHPATLQSYADIMGRHALKAASAWRDGQMIDLRREMMHLALGIVSEALFGRLIGSEVDEISRAMDLNVAMFRRLTSPWGLMKIFLPTPFSFRYLLARRKLVGTLRGFIAERRKSGCDRDDLLSRLLKARAANDADGSGMSESQLIAECVTLFAAGHETTANALTFAFWLLAQHPAAAERLQQEVDSALPEGRLPTVEDLSALSYARMIVAESMRLFPPAWIIGRQAIEPAEIGGQPVPRGAVVFVSQWITHRDPRWWPDPERFDPERFSPDQRGDHPRWAYFPFGGGSRQCVGEAFAWAEAVLVLAVIAGRWRMELAEGVELPLEAGITLRPAGVVRIIARARKPSGSTGSHE